MISRLSIENLRGVASGTVEGLGPLSVLVGPNNSGKSTILEALYLSGGVSPVTLAEVVRRRGWFGVATVDQWLRDPTRPGVIEVEGEGPSQRWTFEVVEAPNESRRVVYAGPAGAGEARFDSSGGLYSGGVSTAAFVDVRSVTEFGHIEDAYSRALDRGQERQLDELVSAVAREPTTLRILKRADRYVMHTVTSRGALAIYLAGDGFKRLVWLAATLAGARGGLVLIEEPEVFLHPGYFERVAGLVWAAVLSGSQIVLSTHSQEFVRALAFDGRADLPRLALFKARLHAGLLTVHPIVGREVTERIDEFGEDLRW